MGHGETGLLAVQLQWGGKNDQIGPAGGNEFLKRSINGNPLFLEFGEPEASFWRGIDPSDKGGPGGKAGIKKSVDVNVTVASKSH